MGKDIDELGRVVLDGLFFDHDKATLTAQSKPALAEIAKFLAMRPQMTFYVVGHTDGTGAFDYNRKLCRGAGESSRGGAGQTPCRAPRTARAARGRAPGAGLHEPVGFRAGQEPAG